MDWMENTGILNQVNQHASTNSQATNGDDSWSLNSTDTTKQPLDKILGVKKSFQTELNYLLICHSVICCFGICVLCCLGLCVTGYALLPLCSPESTGAFAFIAFICGLEGFFISLAYFLGIYIAFGKFIKWLSTDNPIIAKFISNHMRVRSDGFTTSLDTFLIVPYNTYDISTTRYTMTFTKLFLVGGNDNVWYISVKPKLPKELSSQQANLFTINVD